MRRLNRAKNLLRQLLELLAMLGQGANILGDGSQLTDNEFGEFSWTLFYVRNSHLLDFTQIDSTIQCTLQLLVLKVHMQQLNKLLITIFSTTLLVLLILHLLNLLIVVRIIMEWNVFVRDVIVVLFRVVGLIELREYGLHTQIYNMCHAADLCVLCGA